MDKDSVRKLAAAIVAQGVSDYMDALIHDDKVEIGVSRTFFSVDSGWFEWLSGGLDGEYIMEQVEVRARKFIQECLQHQPRYGNWREAEKAAFKCPCCGGKVTIKFGGNPLGKGRIFSRFYNYLCSKCGLQVKIRDNDDEPERIKNVITTAECSRCEKYDASVKRCLELGKRREYDDVCFGWENTKTWRDWLMRTNS